MYKAIIFDVDGTLSETEEIHRRAFNGAFETRDLSWHWDRILYRDLLRVTGGKERIRHFMQAHDRELPTVTNVGDWVAELHRIKTSFYTQMIESDMAVLRPGIRDFIHAAKIKGIRLAIATTTSVPNVEALLASAFGRDSQDIFEVICAGDCVPTKKPAPDIYLRALELLGLDPSDCIAIEDSRNGLLSAFLAGIDTLVTPSIYTDDQSFDEAVLIAGNLSDLTPQSIFDTVNETLSALG